MSSPTPIIPIIRREPFDDPAWLFDLKLDGFRGIADTSPGGCCRSSYERIAMIIREWRGRASPSRAEAYPKHFRDNVVPELQQIPGFLGARLSQRRIDDKLEFPVLTRWQSMDSIRAFAGANAERAVVEPAP
jgi:heme-degrading monooxygenase HmoA